MPAVPGLSGLSADPVSLLLHLMTSILTHFVNTARDDVTTVLGKYLMSTADVSSAQHGALTARQPLRGMNFGLAVAMDVLIAAVLTYASMRSLFERALRPHYSLKIVLPKLLAAIVFIHFSLPLMQMAIDLNNALCSVAMSLGEGVHAGNLPWTLALSPPAMAQIADTENLFRAVFAIALIVALVILMLAYVIRYAMLGILIVTAPVAALCTVLPETVGYARTWLRLFLVTVFMQAVQLIILRIAVVTAMDSETSTVQIIYSLATLWIMLKVPGALGTASHLETKGRTIAHGLAKSAHKSLMPAHSRTTAHHT